jgi:hypothetical protein
VSGIFVGGFDVATSAAPLNLMPGNIESRKSMATATVAETELHETSPAARLSHLRLLEAESIHVFREVAAEFEKPVMLYTTPGSCA